MKTSLEELLQPQDWIFPVPIAYGPGRLREIGAKCVDMGVSTPLIVTDRGSRNLPFIAALQSFLTDAGLRSDLFFDISPNPRDDEIGAGRSAFRNGQHDAIIDPDRFDAVQIRLIDRSAKPRNKPATAHPSPLAGKLFDETGDRLTPSHASKAGKRYRYYVSRRLIAGAEGDTGIGWRLPADRLERDLGRAVREHLITGVESGNIGVTDAGSIARLRSHAEALGNGVLNCLDRVQIGNGMLSVDLNAGKIADLLSIAPNCIASEVLSFCRPFSQRRRGVESRLIIGT